MITIYYCNCKMRSKLKLIDLESFCIKNKTDLIIMLRVAYCCFIDIEKSSTSYLTLSSMKIPEYRIHPPERSDLHQNTPGTTLNPRRIRTPPLKYC